MPVEKMIPWLWFRVIALLIFFVVMLVLDYPFVAIVALVMFILSAWQLRTAYRHKSSQ